MTQWKSLFKLLIAIAPAVPIMLGIVLRMGWLAAAGVIAYLALILAATLIRVSRNPESGYGFHIQFRQGHQADVDYVARQQKQDRDP
jgi:uncharacterized protein (DUF58 family)